MRAEEFLELNDTTPALEQSATLSADAFLDAESFLDGGDPAEPEIPSMNMARGAAERSGQLLGGLFTAADTLADKAEETFPLGGLVWDDGIIPSYKGPDEYAEFRKGGMAEPLETAANYWANVDAGYVPNHTWEKLKSEFSENGPLSASAWGEVLAYGAEQGIKSIPDMVAVMTAMPSYIMARSGEIGQTRAENKGKVEADIVDVMEAFPAALGSAIFERIGAGGITQAGAEVLGKEALKAGISNIGKEALKAGGKEALTEAVQEGIIEYLGEKLGTDAAMSVWEAIDRGAAGAVAGGVYGTAAGAGGAAVNQARNRDQAGDTEAEADQTQEAETSQDWTDTVLAEEFLDSEPEIQAASEAPTGTERPAAEPDDNAPVNDYYGRPEWATEQTNIFRDGVQPAVTVNGQPAGALGLSVPDQGAAQPADESAPPHQKSAVGALNESGTGVFRVPVDRIKVDPEQYQFRTRVNEQGVDQRLSGVKKWDDRRAGSVLLHRRKDGSLYVADGHHRVDLAKRLGQPEINAQIIDEADGVGVSAARVDAAMNNIADNKAEPIDVAKVFRDSEVPTSEVRDTFNLPNNQVVRDGESLSKLSDNVFGMVTAGQLSEKDGAAIGSAFDEPGQQEAAADAFQKVQPDTEYQRQLLINEIRAAEFADAQGEQGGLFGDDPQEVSLMQDRLKVLDSLRQRLNSDKRLFKSLNDNADRATRAGNQIATEANESITQQSARTLDLIGRVTTTPALNEMVNRAARRVYDGENRSKVVTELKQELMSYEAGADASVGRPTSTPQGRKPASEPGQELGTGESVSEPDTAGADQGRQPESQQDEVTPSLDLETQTEEQLAKQARAREEAQQAEARQKREEEQRADADEQVGSFTLTGSDRSADVAMAAGQDDMFVSTPASRQVEQAGAETDTNPTDGQKQAGNYRKGRVRIQGLDIAIENPKGSTRSGTDPDGKRWESTMAHHYGDIKGTKAADGDNLDVFIGPYPEIDQVFVIDQQNADGSFDEHKVMLGFANEADAKQGYLDNYEDGWNIGPITRMSMDEFKAWMRSGDTTKPLNPKAMIGAARWAGSNEPEVVVENNGVPYYQVNEDQIALDFDADPNNDGQTGNLQGGQRGAGNASAQTSSAGRRGARIQNQRQSTKQIERQSFLHGQRAVTSAAEAAHVLAPFRKDAHETMLGLVLDSDRRPLAIVRHSKGTVDGAPVYPEQFVSDVASVPGADSIWLSHNHPSGRMEPSQADLKITQTLGPMIKNANLKLEGHVIIGFGRDHIAFDVSDRSDGGMSVTTAAARKHRIPVLERQIASKAGMKDAKPIRGPQDAVAALKEMADKDQTGVMLLDNAHRPLGFLDLSGYDLDALRGAGAYRDVLQALATTNANAGIIQAGTGVSDTSNLQRMLSDMGGFRLLDAVHVDTLRGAGANYDSVSSLGSLQAGVWFSRTGYRRTPGTRPQTLSAKEARAIAGKLMRDWKGRPPVTIAERISEFPAGLQAAIREAGAEADMRAVFWNQQVYILAPRIPNRKALEEVILHEVVGHYGLRKLVGADLVPLLNRVYMDLGNTREAEKLKAVYFPGGFDPKNMEHRLVIAEELLAHLAESGKQRHRSLWQRIVAAVRDGLRRLGFTVRLNENDLLNILAGAQKTVEQNGFSRPGPSDMNFSRADHAHFNGTENAETVEILFHDSPEAAAFTVSDRVTTGLDFGGVFAGSDGGMYGEHRHAIVLNPDSILTVDDFESLDETSDEVKAAVRKAAPWMTDEQIEQAWPFIAETENAFDSDADVETLFKADDAGEASWEAQRIRGQVAKALGYQAVEMNDETGVSVLVLPGVTTYPILEGESTGDAEARIRQEWEDWKRQGAQSNQPRHVVPTDGAGDRTVAASVTDNDPQNDGEEGRQGVIPPGARFSRGSDEQGSEPTPQQRQVKFWDGFATQPLDRMFRALFDVTGMVDSHGRMKAGVRLTEGAERVIKEWRPNPSGRFTWMDGVLETARHGLLDRYKLTDEYKIGNCQGICRPA